MTPLQSGQILETLRQCGVSPFNVMIGNDGCVVFRSNGLTREEVYHAQFELVKCLLRQRKAVSPLKDFPNDIDYW